MRVVLERCYNDLRLLGVANKTLKAEGFFRSNKVRFILLVLFSKFTICQTIRVNIIYLFSRNLQMSHFSVFMRLNPCGFILFYILGIR